MATKTKTREYFNFNSQDYDFVVSFNNGERNISLNSESLVELEIQENFLEWYMEGYIIIDNMFDHFERLADFNDSILNPEDLDYKYRGDGRDLITIKIFPKIDSINNKEGTLQPPELKPNIWEIFLEGIIYDAEEIPTDEPQNKRKKFYFWEKQYHLMLEKNIEFTTANVGANEGNENFHNMSNDDRSLKTGEAIYELLYSNDELKNHLPKKDSQSEEEAPWTYGDEKNTIFYTSPSNYKLLDDLNHLLKIHTNTEEDNYDISFLRFNRRKDENTPKKFSFESLSSFFNKAGTSEAGDYQLERFTLMDLHETDKPPIKKSPQSEGINFEKDIRSFTRSEVFNYQFVEMAGLDSANNINIKPVHTYWERDGQFNIHIKENTPEKAKDFQKNNYTNKIGRDSHPRLQLNEWKKNGYNLENTFFGNTSKEARFSAGRNKILLFSLLQGSAISFTARGQTSRQAGRFFSIEKNKYNDTDFDDRLEGQYLAVEVKHFFDFKKQDYENQIVGAKLHRYRTNNDATPEDDSYVTDPESNA